MRSPISSTLERQFMGECRNNEKPQGPKNSYIPHFLHTKLGPDYHVSPNYGNDHDNKDGNNGHISVFPCFSSFGKC